MTEQTVLRACVCECCCAAASTISESEQGDRPGRGRIANQRMFRVHHLLFGWVRVNFLRCRECTVDRKSSACFGRAAPRPSCFRVKTSEQLRPTGLQRVQNEKKICRPKRSLGCSTQCVYLLADGVLAERFCCEGRGLSVCSRVSENFRDRCKAHE